MSRHSFDCEFRCNVRVHLGYEPAYDNQPHEFFLEVRWVDAGNRPEHPHFLYASRNDPHDPGDDIDYYREKLAKLGLVVPGSLFEEVLDDAIRGDGSRQVQHFADGRIVEVSPRKE